MAVNPLLAGAGLIGTAAAVGGGLYVSGILTNEEKVNEQEPSWQSRSKDSDYTPDGRKYGQIYGLFLVGIGADNDDWWTWSYNQRYKGSRKTKNGGFERDITNGETLKAACQKAYEGIVNWEKQEIPIDNISFKETEVWKFCSSVGKKEIQTLWDVRMTGERYGKKEPYGGKDEYKNVLVATMPTWNKANKQFWDLKFSELRAATDLTSGSMFDDLKLGKTITVTRNGKQEKLDTLPKVCLESYGKNESDKSQATRHPKVEIFRFCSLTGVAPSSQT